jgi:hypothetical protein
MQATSQAPVVEQENAMDAGLKSLRIDRTSKQTGRATGSSRRKIVFGLALLLVLVGGWLIYSRLTAATEVETVRVRASSIPSGDLAGATILNATGYIVAAHKIELASKSRAGSHGLASTKATASNKDSRSSSSKMKSFVLASPRRRAS